ncbi:MAG TPA: Ig-like domain-containing protein [Candidatus Faecivivens stercorigallinarum]|nr:Ig-like domain-containing protein [Candidatus Faecivivens stercorigallinarum]
MKKRIASIFTVLTMLLMLVPAGVFAEGEGIAIDATNFPDATFRALVQQQYDQNNDGSLSQDERENVTEMYVDYQEISDLTGIEHFPNLQMLACSGNKLTTLDVSKCEWLSFLDCSGNQLTTLDVSKNTQLSSLDCSVNKLTTLDVSNNVGLNILYCSNNRLTTLDVSNNEKLNELNCFNNQLTTLDVSKCANLQWLNCTNNALLELYVNSTTGSTIFDVNPQQVTREVTSVSGDNGQISWTLDLSTLFDNWENVASLEVENANLGEDGKTVSWTDSSAQPVVQYNYQCANNKTMWVELYLRGIIPVTGVKLGKEVLSLEVGDSEQLQYTIEPVNATAQNVKWESSNPAAVTVNENGLVTAVSVGSAVITVTTLDGSYTDSCTVTVTGTEKTVVNLTLTASETNLTGGGTVTLTLTGLPEGTDAELKCSDGTVAISGSGSSWTATLPNKTADYTFTASFAGNNTYAPAESVCTVSVTEKVDQPEQGGDEDDQPEQGGDEDEDDQPEQGGDEDDQPEIPDWYPDEPSYNPGGSSSGSTSGGSTTTDEPETEWVRDENGNTYFVQDGEKVTGWVEDGGSWYYMDEETAIMSEDCWVKVDNVWYAFDDTGVMLTGWQKIDGVWYYLKDWGGMATGWQMIDGVWYYLRAGGSMAGNAWVQTGGYWYYLTGNGAMAAARWIEWKGHWYYLYSSGIMATNATIGGYYVNSNGVWVQ